MFIVKIETDNAAFVDENSDFSYSTEVARILRSLADQVESNAVLGFEATLRDFNGNPVGKAVFTAD